MKGKYTYILIISILCFITLACKNNLFTNEKEADSNKAYVSFTNNGIGRAAHNAPDFFQSEELEMRSVTKVVFKAISAEGKEILKKEFEPDFKYKQTAVDVFVSQYFELDEGTYTFTADFYALDITSEESKYPVLTASIQNQNIEAGKTYYLPFVAHYVEFGDIQIKYYWEADTTNKEVTEQINYVEMALFTIDNLEEPVEGSEEFIEVSYDEYDEVYYATYSKLHVPCGEYFLKVILYNSFDEDGDEKYGVDRLGVLQSFVLNRGNKVVDERFINFDEYDKIYSIHYDLRGGSWNEEDSWHKYVNTFNPLIQKNLTSASLVSGISKIENSEGQLKDIQWKMTNWYEVQSDKAVTLTPLLTQDENNNYTGGDYYLYAKWSLPYCYVYSLEKLDGTYEEYYPEQIRERRKECHQEELITKKADFEDFISNIATDDFNEEELQPGFEKCTEDFASWDIYNYLGSLIVKVAYKCNRKTVTNTYICNAKDDDANFQNTIEKTGKYGAEISTVEPVEYEGYNFICWKKEVSENNFENCDLPSEFGTEDSVYYAVYEEDRSYPASGTQLALYNFDYFGENNYSLYLVDNAAASLDSSSANNFGYKSNYGSSDVSFCYDKEGKVYAFSCYYSSDLHRTIVTSNNSYEIPSSVLGTSDSLTSITIDRKKDNLYIYGYSGYQGEEPYFIYSWPKASLSNMAASTKKYSLLTDSLDFTDDQLQSMFHSIKSFAVYNDQIYLPVISASTLSLIKADLSDAEYDETGNVYQLSITEDNISSYEIFEEPLTGYPKISDILWQDDYLYVLVRDVSINDSWYEDPFRSRGALVRINVSDDDYDVLGWTNEPADVSSAGIYFKKDSNWDSFYYEDADHTKLFVMDGTQRMEMLSDATISSYYPTLIIPDAGDSLSEEAFYGPEKFIAIKPKKLVIADDGFAFYTNEDGALSYRNVNRVVEVDLEEFAITDSTEVSVKFAGDASSSFSGDYTRDITKDHYIADSGNFYYGSGAYEGSIYDKDGETVNEFRGDIYFAIKCADSE